MLTFATFSSRSRVDNLNLRVDAWLFPFLNVHGLVGWFNNGSTDAGAGRHSPGPAPTGSSQPRGRDHAGGIGRRVGTTLAGGLPPFFLAST